MRFNIHIHNGGGGVGEAAALLLFVLGSKSFSISFSKRPSSRVPTLGVGFISLWDELKLKINTINNLYIHIRN